MASSGALTLVLLSLFFNGCNDVVFKKYALKIRSRGVMIAGSGFIWALWQCGYQTLFLQGIATDALTVKFGIIAGIILVLANILLIESLTHLQVSLGSTIYRLNTIGVIVLSFAFLDEPMGWVKLTAIALGIISVLILYQPSEKTTEQRIYILFLLIVIIGSILRASYGVFSKYAINEGASIQGMIPYTALCWVFGGVIYASLVEKRLRLTGKKVIYMILSGTLIFLTVTSLMQAISLADVSTIIPIANCSFIVALVLSGLLNLEQITKRKVIAICIAMTSILMLSKV